MNDWLVTGVNGNLGRVKKTVTGIFTSELVSFYFSADKIYSSRNALMMNDDADNMQMDVRGKTEGRKDTYDYVYLKK